MLVSIRFGLTFFICVIVAALGSVAIDNWVLDYKGTCMRLMINPVNDANCYVYSCDGKAHNQVITSNINDNEVDFKKKELIIGSGLSIFTYQIAICNNFTVISMPVSRIIEFRHHDYNEPLIGKITLDNEYIKTSLYNNNINNKNEIIIAAVHNISESIGHWGGKLII